MADIIHIYTKRPLLARPAAYGEELFQCLAARIWNLLLAHIRETVARCVCVCVCARARTRAFHIITAIRFI